MLVGDVVLRYGIKLVLDNCGANNGYDAGSLNIIFFCILYAAMKIGQIPPLMEAIATARGAAVSIYKIIDRVPLIDSSSAAGRIPDTIQGHIRFHQVHFKYPSRPDVPILDGIDFQVAAGQTVALVGLSGCGKSTCIQLLQRFYDPCLGLKSHSEFCIDCNAKIFVFLKIFVLLLSYY